MAINTQNIRVDLNPGRPIPVAYAHQNDNNREFTFTLYNNGVAYTPSGTTAKFGYKSPIVNGQYSVIAGNSMATGTVSGNTVTVTLPNTYTQVHGVGLLTMILTTSGNTLRPVNIKFVVQSSADGDDVVLGASDWPAGLYDYMDNWLEENEPTEIANLKSDLSELQDGVVYSEDIDSLEVVTDTKSLKNDGTLVAAGGYSLRAEVGAYDLVQFTTKNFMTNSASPYPVTAFTDVSGSIIKMTEAGTYTNNRTYTEEVPVGAKYFYINTWKTNGSISGINRTYSIPDTIEYSINTDFYDLVWTNRIYFWGVGTRSASTTRIGLENMLQARTNIIVSAADGYDVSALVFTSSTEGTANEKRFSNWVKKAVIYSGEYFLINVRKTDDSAIVTSEGYNSVFIRQEDVSNGTVIGSDLIKRTVLTEKIGKIKYFQSFCVYDGNYFSTNGDNIAKQDSSLAEISTTALSVGHGNGFQLGSSNIAYISGWSDQKIYAIDLDTITLDSTITLPTTGYTTAVVDDLNNIAYIFQRDSYPDTETNYNFIAYDYANSTVLYSKLMPNKFGAMQAADFYNGKIIVAYGTGTSETPSGVFVCDTNGCILAEYYLDILQSLEPEGVCFNRDTGTFLVSDVNRNIHKVT